MNFKVNLFFLLYETPFTPFGFPTLIVSRLSGGVGKGGHNWKKQVCFKMHFRQNLFCSFHNTVDVKPKNIAQLQLQLKL